LVSVFIKFKKG